MAQQYFRIRDNAGTLGANDTPGKGTESLEGQTGITDPRFVNSHGYYRRIVGPLCSKILATAKRTNPSQILRGGFGPRVDDVYDVPLSAIVLHDPRNNE